MANLQPLPQPSQFLAKSGWELKTVKGKGVMPDFQYYTCRRIPLEDWQIAAYYGLDKDDDIKKGSDDESDSEAESNDTAEDDDSTTLKIDGNTSKLDDETINAMHQLAIGNENGVNEPKKKKEATVNLVNVKGAKRIKKEATDEVNETNISTRTKSSRRSRSTSTARIPSPTRASNREKNAPSRLYLDHESLSQKYYDEMTIKLGGSSRGTAAIVTPKRRQTLLPEFAMNESKMSTNSVPGGIKVPKQGKGSKIPILLNSNGSNEAKMNNEKRKKGSRGQSAQK